PPLRPPLFPYPTLFRSGSLTFSGDNSASPKGNLVFAIVFTGNGGFATATGSGTLNFIGTYTGAGRFIIDGSLSGPAATFDTTAPDRKSTRLNSSHRTIS